MSFKRAGSINNRDTNFPGTKVSFYGSKMISSGISSFDVILNGGFQLNSLFLFVKDKISKHYKNIFNYLTVQGIASDQNVVYITTKPNIIIENNFKKLPSMIGPDTPKIEEVTKENILQIAHEYKKYMETTKSISNNNFCNQFHLNHYITEEQLCRNKPKIYSIELNLNMTGFMNRVLNIVESLPDNSVSRVIITEVDEYINEGNINDLLKLFMKLRSLCRSKLVSIFINISPELSDSFIMALSCFCNGLFVVESSTTNELRNSEEFKSYDGFLKIRKLTATNNMNINLLSPIFGIKHNYQEVMLSPLNIPPS